jgi:ABC-type iron transport system FetAB permease component
LRDDIHAFRQEIETALALGASSRMAVQRQMSYMFPDPHDRWGSISLC